MSASVISWLPIGVAERLFKRHSKPKLMGIRVVWGIPDRMLPVFGAMPGRWRFRFRDGKLGKLYSRAGSETREYFLEVKHGKWIAHCRGINERRQVEK